MQVTRTEVVSRLKRAADQLLKAQPKLPVDPDTLMRIADQNELPIGKADVDNDIVARALFLRAYNPHHQRKLEKAVEAVWKLFRIPPKLKSA